MEPLMPCESLRSDKTCWRFPFLGVIHDSGVCVICQARGGFDTPQPAPVPQKPCINGIDKGPAPGYPCCHLISCTHRDCIATTNPLWLSKWCGPERCKFFSESVD